MKKKVGLLGAAGLVGQRIIEFLDLHPSFEIKKLFVRKEKSKNLYCDIVDWHCDSKLKEEIASLETSDINDLEEYKNLDFVLSALPSDSAFEIESKIRNTGISIISNASAYRLDKEVPLLVPEISFKESDLELINLQKKKYSGFIATNPNCSVIGISLSIAPIEEFLGIEELKIVTMQAVSGAGLEGFKNKNLLRNVIPNIEGEEDKIIKELPKIFNKDIDIKVRTNRVNVSDGHTFNIFLKTKEKSSYKELINLWKNYKSKTNTFSIKGDLYDIYEDNFMPQPKIVAWKDGGMKTSIGRLVEFSPKEFLFTSVSNNIIRGAAGGTILIAEALNERGVL